MTEAKLTDTIGAGRHERSDPLARSSAPDVQIWFAMTTGTRRGEVRGLRWPHLNLDLGVAKFQARIGQMAVTSGRKAPRPPSSVA